MKRSVRQMISAVLVVSTLSLTGCADEPVPEPQPQAEAAALPVADTSQLDTVMAGVGETLAAADGALDASRLAPRVDGVAVELRTAGYAVRRALSDKGVITPVGTERLLDVVPADQAWPRTVMTVTRTGADDTIPELVLLTQTGPRDPYRMTAWVQLLPGSTVPSVNAPSVGVPVLAVEVAGSLALSPADVVARYADVLTAGPTSQFAAGFTEDAFRTQVLSEQDSERQNQTVTCPGCFTYAVTHTPRAGAVWALGTADGGAIVLGVIDTTRSLAVAAAGAKLPLVDDLSVLSGKTEVLNTATFTSVEVAAFVVPPAGSTAPVQVIGAERALTAAAAT